MTVERRLLFSLADIRAVTFACTKCEAHLSLVPDTIPAARLDKCPACSFPWFTKVTVDNGRSYGDQLLYFVNAISGAHASDAASSEERNVRVLFEFDEPAR